MGNLYFYIEHLVHVRFHRLIIHSDTSNLGICCAAYGHPLPAIEAFAAPRVSLCWQMLSKFSYHLNWMISLWNLYCEMLEYKNRYSRFFTIIYREMWKTCLNIKRIFSENVYAGGAGFVECCADRWVALSNGSNVFEKWWIIEGTEWQENRQPVR